MSILSTSLAAELDITQEEMDSFAEDMYSVSPGCRRVQFEIPSIRSAIAHVSNTTTVEGPELSNVWMLLHVLDHVIGKIQECFGDDTTPPEQGSPKDTILTLINDCLEILSTIGLALDEYGNVSQAQTQHRLSVFRFHLGNAITIILGIIRDLCPLLMVENCHEGMELPADPSSSLQPTQSEEGLEIEELSGSPAHTLDSDQSPPTNLLQAQEGLEYGGSSLPTQPESHDETWTFRVLQRTLSNVSLE